jgi:hypothetical protein
MNDIQIHWPNDPEADTRQCLICLQTGPADMFEPMTASGNVACKARECCAIREAGESPVHYLSALLRSVHQEMALLTTAELAALDVDLFGARHEALDGFAGAVRVHLAARSDSAAALEAERADRERRKRSKAAKAGAATRAARKAAEPELALDPYRAAENWSECPACGSEFGWNDEDGLAGQTCPCGHQFEGTKA